MVVSTKHNFPVYAAAVVEPSGPGRELLVTNAWRNFFQDVWLATRNLGHNVINWGVPTGTGTRATFNMNATYPVSNPPTQAEVQAIAAGLVEVRKRLGQLIIDQVDAGTIT